VGRLGVREPAGSGQAVVLHKDKVAQQYAVLMSSGRAAASALRHAADLLSMAIGDDSGSRLYWALIDPGLADSADCSFHEYEGTGVFYTTFSSEPGRARANLALVRGELAKVQADGI